MPEDLIKASDLDRFGIRQHFLTQNAFLLIIVSIIAFALIALAINTWRRSSALKPTELVGLVIAVGTVFTAYWQWQDARYEASLKEFYDRLDLANRRMERIYDDRAKRDTTSVRTMGDTTAAIRRPATSENKESHWLASNHHQRWTAMDQQVGVHPFEMWVFAEIDNVEYMIQKHQLGFVHRELLVRALNTFRSRCKTNATFARIARFWTSAQKAGYSKDTSDFVRQENVCGTPE